MMLQLPLLWSVVDYVYLLVAFHHASEEDRAVVHSWMKKNKVT